MWNRWVFVAGCLSVIAPAAPGMFATGCSRGQSESGPTETLAAEEFTLPNGLSVDLISGACGDEIALVVHFDVGTDHDPQGRSGMAHLVRHLISASAPAGRSKRLVETGTVHTQLSLTTKGADVPAELALVAAELSGFDVSPASFETAKARVLEEIQQRNGGDATLTAIAHAAESMKPSAGAGFVGGIAAEVSAIERSEALEFVRSHFQAKRTRIVVVGRFDPKNVRALIETEFGKLPEGTPLARRDPARKAITGTRTLGDAPSVVALGVSAPAPDEPQFLSFLLLAARLMNDGLAWQVRYDPFARPEVLFVTGPVAKGEGPESAAARLRAEIAPRVERYISPRDLVTTKERFRRVLGIMELEPAACAKDPRALAVARARRAALGIDSLGFDRAIDRLTQGQLDHGALRFAPSRTASVIAGGVIR